MSTRVYTGFVLPVKRLTHFQSRAYARVVSVLTRELESELKPLASLSKAERSPQYWKIEQAAKLVHVSGYHFFVDGRFAYASQWGNELFTYTGNDLEYVRQYPYWDDLPRPQYITQKHWESRKKQWSKLFSYEVWNRHFTWQVIDGHMIHELVMSLVRGSNNA